MRGARHAWLTGVDWKDVFVPNAPLLEIFIRGTVVYLALYTLLRWSSSASAAGWA